MGRLAAVISWGNDCDLERTLAKLLGCTTPAAADSNHLYITRGAAFGQNTPLFLSPDKRFALVCDARIDDRETLLLLLGEAGKPKVTRSDAELIFCAYLKWGTACPEKLTGDFSFIIWDNQKSELFAACDGMNMRTLNWMRTRNGLCVTSEGQQLLNHPEVTPKYSEQSLAGWICGWPDPNHSMFEGVEVLAPGHSLSANARDIKISKFWDIDPNRQIRYRKTEEYEAHFLELMQCAVTDRLRSPAPVVATQMSAGMDSTTVTALAHERLNRGDPKLLVISHSYRSLASCDETDRINETLVHLGITDSRFMDAEQHTRLDFRDLYPPDLENPGTVLSPRYTDEMEILKAAGAQVLLTGSGGDEMTWGHSLTYSQRLRRGDLGAVWEVFTGCRELQLPPIRTLRQLFVNPFVPARLKRALGRSPSASQLPDWVPKAAIQRLDLEARLLGESSTRFDNPALQARYEALRRTSTLNSVRSYAKVGADYGIEVRHPYFDTRLAEFSFAIPDDLWIRQGYPKWLARRTMDGVLPDAICWNRHKVIFDNFFAGVIRDQAENIRHILADTRLQDIGLLDNSKLLETFDRVTSGRQGFSVDLLYALMAQIWFQKYWG